MVGAPNDVWDTPVEGIERPGAIYRCTTSSPTACQQMRVDRASKGDGTMIGHFDIKEQRGRRLW